MEMELLELSSGVVLELGRAAPLVLTNVTKEMNESNPPPKPPIVYSEEKSREEPNENDPQYLKAQSEWNAFLTLRVIDVLIATSSKVKSIPDGMISHDSDEFLELLEISGITPRRTKMGLYTQWIQLVGAQKDDIGQIGIALLRITGVAEESVAEAEATFRSLQESDTDPEAPSWVNGSDGDRVSDSNPRIGV